MVKSIYTKSEFKKQPEDFRIGVIISDGMWYSFTKWQKYASVSDTVLQDWIDQALKDGRIIQHSPETKSYRMNTENVKQWYRENGLRLGEQIIDFNFPVRIWDNMTESDGLIDAPLREIGMVTFNCSQEVAQRCTSKLKGIARVRQDSPNTYKAYCLDSQLVKHIVSDVFAMSKESDIGKVYSRNVSKRRELADLNPVFREGIVSFYKDFGKSLVKPAQDTLNIFLPNVEDQEIQILIWVIMAIEKFDSSSPVPFSGYLSSVLKRWPYDLPETFLGKELAAFQREKSHAIKALRKENPDKEIFDSRIIADKMGVDFKEFMSLDSRNKLWTEINNASSLIWGETGEEKSAYTPDFIANNNSKTNINQANVLSHAIIKAALESQHYTHALYLVSKIDDNSTDFSYVNDLSKEFVNSLGKFLGVRNAKN